METEYREQYIRFGLKVQYYRKLLGLTQEAFADKIGRSWSYVSKIESPTRVFGVSMETLFKIADALEVTKEWKNTEGAHIPDSVELSLYRKADFVKWNGIINNQEKLKELQEKLNLSGTDFAEFQSKLEAEMNACKENFEYVNSVNLKTNGEESVSYTWEGLSPYFKYEVREKEIPSYISKVIPAQSGSSYYYWVETNSISSNEIIILSSDTTKALAYIDGKLGEKDKAYFDRIGRDMDTEEAGMALYQLCNFLHRFYDRESDHIAG